MGFIDFKSIPTFDFLEGVKGKLTQGEELNFSRFEIEKGSITKPHKHDYEQITFVLDGFYEMTIDGKTEVLTTGKMAIVPEGILHSSHSLSDCVILDVYKIANANTE